ncbi:hypothetical protein WG68_11735 [Arsukibacterium ikkense]|uniref:DUF6351 domain-containing protein n=1 Tax=Arsukibacterium ikkense TaxID=336831 RepID=A0A0M2V640_9GAMM|nr:DUF6351 family protein [Arsukibacterium ikkense]KKO45100.1 hypothetical protein WG68_11735 [Arsukibacterium ikkense]
MFSTLWRYKTLCLTVLLTAGLYLLYLSSLTPGQRWREPNPVQGVAPQQAGPLLQVSSHIRYSPRPPDPYPYPIPLGQPGPHIPLYSGGLSYPLYCDFNQQQLPPPLVDNQQGFGVAVQQQGKTLGYSKDCLQPASLQYFYITADGAISHYQQQTVTADALLVRLELGTINRFFYYLLMPVQLAEITERNSAALWNGKLIYQFHGGVGIGYRQGYLRAERLISERLPQLRQGFAVASASINKTSYGYNFLLAEDTASRVKRQFISLYGQPLYTLGIGGSGGGIAQYLLLQNNPDLLDGGIALYSYPDMLSQTLYALDCDLLHNYYHFTAVDKARWQDLGQRQLLEGLSVTTEHPLKFAPQVALAQLSAGIWPSLPHGASQCHNAWLGLASLIHNPHQGKLKRLTTDPLLAQVNWSYWGNMADIYGRDSQGFGHSLWDNHGVQYGLRALISGELSVADFIALNAAVGSWRPQAAMRPEQINYLPFLGTPLWRSAFGRQNIISSTSATPAARYSADQAAITRAYRYGQLFLGMTDKPIIDLRHYLDPELDMHHLEPSFAARKRLIQRNGHAGNQLIWVSHPDYTPTDQAVALMDMWLTTNQKPTLAVDQCFAADGRVIAAGDTVWLDNGDCSTHYPPLSNSRLQAGAPGHGLMFSCALISVEQAIARGIYHTVDMQPYAAELRAVFADGVCDYSMPDQAMPADLTFPY